MSDIGYCQFCHSTGTVRGKRMICETCHVEYLFEQNRYACIFFSLTDPEGIYSMLSSDTEWNETRIWLCRTQPAFIIKHVFLDITPKNALQFAKRLHSLKAFL
jgi:formate-dependent nitrite reductase cytochrome c552 subunit